MMRIRRTTVMPSLRSSVLLSPRPSSDTRQMRWNKLWCNNSNHPMNHDTDDRSQGNTDICTQGTKVCHHLSPKTKDHAATEATFTQERKSELPVIVLFFFFKYLSNASFPLFTFRMLRIFSSVRIMSSLTSWLMIVLRVLLLHPSLKILRTNPRTSHKTDRRQDTKTERKTSLRCSQHAGQSQGSPLSEHNDMGDIGEEKKREILEKRI